MPPVPGDVDLEYTEKKIHLKGPAHYKVVDPQSGKVLEDIDVGPGGEYDGKVADISVKAKMLSSKALSGTFDAAVAGKIQPPGIEIAMELPVAIVDSPATRFVCEVADARTNVHVPVTAYGVQTSYRYVQREAAAATLLASPRPGHDWVGFRIEDVDFARFARYYDPTDVYFRLSAEQINGRHAAFGKRSRASLAVLDSDDGSPLVSYVSELTYVHWLHVQREVAPFGAPQAPSLPTRRQVLELANLLESGNPGGE